jgi:hypothetical protein
MYLGQAGNTAVNNSSKSFHHDNMKGIISGSKWRLLLLISLGIMIIFSSASSLSIFVNADNLNPGVYSKDSKPFEVPYGDWLARWNQWFIQIPKEVHPRDNYTPERCATDQTGPVWFLVNIQGKRGAYMYYTCWKGHSSSSFKWKLLG